MKKPWRKTIKGVDLLKKNTKQVKALLADVDRTITVMEIAKKTCVPTEWTAHEEGVLVLLRCFKYVLATR